MACDKVNIRNIDFVIIITDININNKLFTGYVIYLNTLSTCIILCNFLILLVHITGVA